MALISAKRFLVIVCSVAAAALLFVIGLYVGGRIAIEHLNVQMNGTQAMLAYNRISDEQKLHDFLSHGCASIALMQVDVNEDQDMRLLSEFFRGPLPPWARDYVLQRDPALVRKLSTFKSKYGNSWTIPDCRKQSPLR